MSEKAIWDGSTALRGGIPVCWPWFGRIAAPAHGFARNTEWQLIEHRENETGVIVSLGLKPTEETLAIWPHQFEVVLNIEVSKTLTVTLDVKNTDQAEWAFSGALHSYFNIGDIHQANITGMGENYIDGLQDDKVCLGGETLTFNASIDRVYTAPKETIEINDVANERTIQIANQGENSAVIWNPWELAAGMKDMDDDGYETMVCVESTLHTPTLEEGKILQPGESHQLVTEIQIKA